MVTKRRSESVNVQLSRGFSLSGASEAEVFSALAIPDSSSQTWSRFALSHKWTWGAECNSSPDGNDVTVQRPSRTSFTVEPRIGAGVAVPRIYA